MKQVIALLYVVGLCYGILEKRNADYNGVAVSPVHQDTKCHTEYDNIISQACNTITEQACNTINEEACITVAEQKCKTVTEQACNTVTEQACNTVTDYVSEQQCNPVVVVVPDIHCSTHNNPICHTEKFCHTEYDTIIDTTTVEDCHDIITQYCTETHTKVHTTSNVVSHAVGLAAIGHAEPVAIVEANPVFSGPGYGSQHHISSGPQCEERSERQCLPRQEQTPRKVPRKVCGSEEVCIPNAKDHCVYTSKTVTKTTCQNIQVPVPREQCHEVPREVCHPVPREVCISVPTQKCHHVPREICKAMPRMVCNPVQQQIPRQVCTHTQTQTVAKTTTYVKSVGSHIVGKTSQIVAVDKSGAGIDHGAILLGGHWKEK